MRVPAGIAALALAAFALLPGRAAEPMQRDLLEAVERQLTQAHETAGPAVACVVVSRSDKYPKPAKPPDHAGQLGAFDPAAFPNAEPGQAVLAGRLDLSRAQDIADHPFAGGVVIDAAGLVLTNYHTIEGATKLFVHLAGGGGSYADIHAADARSDLAVLRLLTPPAGLKPIRLGEARLSDGTAGKATVVPGKLVVLLASPLAAGFGAGPPPGAVGSVTTLYRRPPASNLLGGNGTPPHRSVYNYTPVIVHNARPNYGCSGLPLLTLGGDMIGLTTTTATADGGDAGSGYALPFDANVRRVIDVLRRGEEVEYGFLGVVIQSQNGPGISVRVTPQSPAAAALGDAGEVVIRRINGHPVSTFEDLLLHAGSALAGTTVRLEVDQRGRVRRAVDVTLAKYRGDTPFVASVRPDPVFGLRVDYGSVLAQALADGTRDGVPPGVVVRELVPDSPAAAKFKALGDNTRWLVTHVNGTATPNPADFYAATKGRASVKLTVIDPAEASRPREVTLP